MIEIHVLIEVGGGRTMLAKRSPSGRGRREVPRKNCPHCAPERKRKRVPSPPPSPLRKGRGRIVAGPLAKGGSWRASTFSNAHWDPEPDGRVSLSPGERVGVRGKGAFGSPSAPAPTNGSWRESAEANGRIGAPELRTVRARLSAARRAAGMPGEAARWIHIRENLLISRRFCPSEAGRDCPQRAVVRVPAYIRGALRTTLPTSLVPAMPSWDGRALPRCSSGGKRKQDD